MLSRSMLRTLAVTAAAGSFAATAVVGGAAAAFATPTPVGAAAPVTAPVAVPAPAAVGAPNPGSAVANLPGDNDLYQGQVIAKTGLSVRTGPSTANPTVGLPIPYGTVIRIECKVDGRPVDGNPRWYKLDDARYAKGWVTARYVDNIGRAPHDCPATMVAAPQAGAFQGQANTQPLG